MKTLVRNIVIFIAALLMAACEVRYGSSEHVLFQSDVTDSIPYRIPTIAAMHNGDILIRSMW